MKGTYFSFFYYRILGQKKIEFKHEHTMELQEKL
jgi:hypothetical protein